MTSLKKICFVEKGYNINRHIDEYKDLYPTEFTIIELDPKEIKWEKAGDFVVLDKKFVDKITKGYEDYDISSFFIESWKQGKKNIRGYHSGRQSNGIEINATKFRNFYHGTAEHEDLHSLDDIILQYGGIRIENILGVKSFDDDVVHRPESRSFYNFDDVWKKVAPFLSHALAIRRKRSKPKLQPISIPKPKTVKGEQYRPKNFNISELVSPSVLSRLGEELCWQMFDERALRNLQWLRNRFGVTFVNIPGRFSHRGFDAGGFRKNGTSQHNHGRAFDMHFLNYSIQEVFDIIEVEHKDMPEPNITIEWTYKGKTPSWLHMDVRYSNIKGLNKINV